MAEDQFPSPSAPGFPLAARPEFNVVVRDFILEDGPASLHYRLNVGSLTFSSTISYLSIPAWSEVFTFLPARKNCLRLISALIAWDAMRFLALGGQCIVLPPGLPCDAAVSHMAPVLPEPVR